jgi:hypothetical protein
VSLCCRSPFPGSFPFWASPFPSRLANASGRIEFIIFLIMDWLFASGCFPPRLSTTQLPSTTDSQCSVRRGLPPRCWCALSGALGTKQSFAPRLRTGQANLSHPALQLVVSLQRRSADASRAPLRIEHGMHLLPGRPTDAVQQSKVCILALLFTVWSPEDIRGACFLQAFVLCLHLPTSLGSTGITPLLRYYGGSVTFRARFFGLYLQP